MNLKGFTQRKWSLSLLFLTVLVYGHSGTMDSPDQKEIPLVEAIQEISKEYGVYFSFDRKLVENISVHYDSREEKSLESAISAVLRGTDLQFRMFDQEFIIIYRKDEQGMISLRKMMTHMKKIVGEDDSYLLRTTNRLPLRKFHDNPYRDLKGLALNITGVVTDNEQEPLIGVNVRIKGEDIGTSTDINGEFSIDNVNENATLVFSYIGYQTIEIPVDGRTNLEVTMITDSEVLNEVVVVGYGTVQRRELTGSVTSLDRREILSEPTYSVESVLQGRAAGVDVVATSFRPGAGATVRIRGARSMVASNDPLIVMDGIPIDGNLMDINPSDIASIEILKDASATAIYGSRGSNGVILITTRRGFDGKPQIEYSGSVGVQTISNKVELMDADQYVEMNREAARRQGSYTTDENLFLDWELEGIRNGVNTDWQDVAFNNGFQQNHQLSIRGGTEFTKYSLSGTFLEHNAMVDNNDFTRIVGRLNLDQKITDRLRAGISTQVVNSTEYQGGNFRDLLLRSPIDWPERAETALSSKFAVGESFPTLLLDRDLFIDERNRTRIITNIFGEIDLLEGLSYRFNFAPDLTYYDRGTHTYQTSVAGVSNEKTNNVLYENILTYDKTFFGKHKLKATGLYSVQNYRKTGFGVNVMDLPFEQQRYFNIGTAETTTSRYSSLSQWVLESYMVRLNYAYNSKYVLTLTGRIDGSSRLAEGNKYGLFPSIAGAWLLNEEDFIARSGFFDELKLRVSYGEVGNTGISPYQTQGRVQRTGYSFGDESVFGFQSAELANTELRWERTNQVDIGVDFGFLDYRISGTIGVYQQHTKDLLMNRQLPPTSGFVSVLENVGATKNTGIEFNISTTNFESSKKNGFTWTTDFVFHSNKNEIVELFGGTEDDLGNGWFIGHPIDVSYDHQFEGIWQTSEKDLASTYGLQPGDIKLADINNDGKINGDDRVIIGSSVPAWTGSLNNRFSYAGFDLSVYVYTTQDVTIFSEAGGTSLGGMLNLRRGYNLNSRDVDYWTPDNPSNEFPRPRVSGHPYSTPMGYFDASYVRVRNIMLGYTIQEPLLKKLKITRARVYAGVQNPFTFTDFPGLDPEGARDHDMPNYRNFHVGFEVNF